MIKTEQVQSLKLQIEPINDKICLLVENALNWIGDNTTIKVDMNDLENAQANVRFFIDEYIQIMQLPIGITSESASGLSQSFDSSKKSDLILSLAETIFGDEKLTTGKVSFVAATSRW